MSLFACYAFFFFLIWLHQALVAASGIFLAFRACGV